MGDHKVPAIAFLRRKNQLTLPVEVSEAAHIAVGDMLEIRLVSGGILLKPKKLVDADQAWFWTSEWQKGEREASEDIARGHVKRFESDEDFLEHLGD